MEECAQWPHVDETGGRIVIGRQRFVGSLICGLLVLALSGCGPSAEDRAELYYRLKVEVETPQGLRTGSSVIWVKAVRNPNWVNPEGRGIRTRFRGEAVAIDLPNGRTIFALLRTVGGNRDAPAEWPVTSFGNILDPQADFVDDVKQLSQITRSGVMRPLPKTEHVLPNGGDDIPALPLLVTFKDKNDPGSIVPVDSDDLAASFGAGYRLKAITAEISSGPVTTGIAKKLDWLNSTKGALLNVDIADYPPLGVPLPFAANIVDSDFKAGGR
jgi:hypothetical protein